MRRLLLLPLLWLAGCTLAFKFDECTRDADCPTAGGKAQFCTADRLCTVGTPVERMCKQVYPASPAQNAVPVGAILTLPTDNLSLQALQLGVDEINALAGSGQRPLVLHVCDASGTSDDALKALKHLGRVVGAVGVVGPTSSNDVLAVAAEAGAAQVPIVSPSATTPSISNLTQQRGFIFRIAPSDDQQGAVLASLVAKAMGTKLALLFVDDTYGNGLQAPFLTAWLKASGQTGATVTASFPEGNMDRVNAAADAAIAAGVSDAVVISYLDSPALLQRLQGLPMSSRVWMTDGAKTTDTLAVVDGSLQASYLQRVKGTAPTVATGQQAYVGFRASFMGKFGVDPSADAFSAYSYDALYAIAIAVANGKGSPTGPLVSAGLRRISGADAATRVGQSSYLEAVGKMAAGMAVPLDGASGEIRFTDTGDRQRVLFEQWSIDPVAKRFTSAPAM